MNKWIEKLKTCYKENFKRYEEQYKNAESEIEKFRKDFSIERWENLSVKEYKTIGKNNKSSLCYLLENVLKPRFRYLPNPVTNDIGYGYRFNQNKNKYEIGNKYFGRGKGNSYIEIPEEEINIKWEKAKQNIVDYLKSIEENKGFESIVVPESGNIIDIGVYIDLGYIYYPHRIIGNIKYLEIIAERLNLDVNNIKSKYEKNNYKIALNYEINKIIREDKELKNANGYMLSAAIWDLCEKERTEKIKLIVERPELNKIIEKAKKEKKTQEAGKNVIIYGVPGSGKSFYIKENILKDKNGKNLDKNFFDRVTFFQEYSYYDFIGQRQPDETGKLKFCKGPFTKILEKALNDHYNQYYLIIEEINRGNAEAIFGDILQLLDRDPEKNGEGEYGVSNIIIEEITLNKDVESEVKEKIKTKGGIYIPSNLSIYATLNNADQNVFNIDSAFYRRWEDKIQYCNPSKNEKNDKNKNYFDGYIKGTDVKWNMFREVINGIMLDKNEQIYNAEDKRMGMYYINSQCLSENTSEENMMHERELFGSKILKYLWNDVFKNCREDIFHKSINCLEELIQKFANEGDIYNIFLDEINEKLKQKEE